MIQIEGKNLTTLIHTAYEHMDSVEIFDLEGNKLGYLIIYLLTLEWKPSWIELLGKRKEFQYIRPRADFKNFSDYTSQVAPNLDEIIIAFAKELGYEFNRPSR